MRPMKEFRERAATRRTGAALGLAAALLAAAPAQAQPEGLQIDRDAPVALVADRVSYDDRAGTVTAEGSVEVFHGERSLTASRIVYDSRTGRISADGPIVLRTPEGATVLADAAAIDSDLRAGVVQGARAVIGDGAASLAAVEGQRIDGRYTAFSKAVYSSCQVCPEAPTPLWRIRARRVIHDEAERVVHYEDAVFDVMGAPVLWLPYFSLPDPTVTRRSGFLAPTVLQSTTYGYAAKIPYFIAIDPSRDATITAFPTTDDGLIMEGEYRQAFDFGEMTLSGSGGSVDTAPGGGRRWRGAMFGEGRFDAADFGAPSGTVAGFDFAFASDDGYLRRYDFTNDDRLESEVFVENWGPRDFFSLWGAHVQSLREDEPQDEIPLALPGFSARKAYDAPEGLGEIGFETSGVLLTRQSGRDVARLSLGADWRKDAVLDNGAAVAGFAAVRGDVYSIADDPNFDDDLAARLAPYAGVEIGYPLIAHTDGAAHLLQPRAQLVAAPNAVNSDDIPNEDSLIVEFDETNIFDPNRFPGADRVESGTRLNVGLRYTRIADDPTTLDASVGQVFRLSEEGAFSEGSGLSEKESDTVASLTFGYDPYFMLTNRIRVDEDFQANRAETRGRISLGPARLQGGYVYLAKDATAGADDDREELELAAELDLTPNWRLSGAARRDLQEDATVEAGVALRYLNECAAVELFLSRDFTETADAPASTDFGVRVSLFGLADGGAPRSGVCGARR